jgi:hypothetical protein
MGYRSQIAIGIDLGVVTQDLIHPIIPPVLRFEEKRKMTKLGCFWVLEDWKWYDSDCDVRDILRFFEEMDDIPRFEHRIKKVHLDNEEPVVKQGFNVTDVGIYNNFTQAAYGAIRIGEDADDSEYWGSPEEYEMYTERHLITPYYEDHDNPDGLLFV